jgi:hypothetical protein
VALADPLGLDRALTEAVLVQERLERIPHDQRRQLQLRRLRLCIDYLRRRHFERAILSSRGENCLGRPSSAHVFADVIGPA